MMPIFIEADIPLYFPSICLTGAAFNAFILQVQSLIESPLGANRPLEKQRHTEKLRLNTTLQTQYLSYSPVDLTDTPVVKARIGNAVAAVSGAVIPQHEWITLDSNKYQIDEIDGKISLNVNRGSNLAYAYGGANLGYSSWFTEILVEYTAGYDFTDNNNPTIKQLKAAASLIAQYLYGDGTGGAFSGKRVKVEDVDEEYRVEYFEGINSGDRSGLYGTGMGKIPQSLMLPFQRLRPLEYGI